MNLPKGAPAGGMPFPRRQGVGSLACAAGRLQPARAPFKAARVCSAAWRAARAKSGPWPA